jgi:hypothetical protein
VVSISFIGLIGEAWHPHDAGSALAAVVVEWDGFADAGQFVDEFADGQVQAGVFGGAAHEVGDGQGEHGVEHVDADLLVGPSGALGRRRPRGGLWLVEARSSAALRAVGPAPGETVLVSGATGGVGGYVVQLAAARGAIVIATATPGSKADHVRELGAQHAVDHRRDLAAQVRELAPDGVDVVMHLAGDGLALASLLTDGGRIASTLHLGPEQLADRNVKATAVMAAPTPDVLGQLAADAADGRLRMPVARTYSLGEVPQALADFTKGTVGKLAVSVS